MPDESEVTITVSGVPPNLLKQIDDAARADGRNRSSFIRRELEKLLSENKRAIRRRKAA